MNLSYTSKRFALNTRDILKGLLMAMLASGLFVLQQGLDSGNWNFNWKQVLMAAGSGGAAYLLKNYFSPTKTVIVHKKGDDGPLQNQPLDEPPLGNSGNSSNIKQ